MLSPDERWVAVSNETSNDIYFLDTASMTIAGKVAVPANPRGMRFSPDSRQLYVASEQAHMLSLLDVERRKLIRSVPTGGERLVTSRSVRQPAGFMCPMAGPRIYEFLKPQRSSP